MTASRYMNSKQFRKEIDSKKLDNIYLFMGEEEGEKDKFINAILNIIFKNVENRNNYIGRFHIENDEFIAAADYALSQSMFSSYNVCIMQNIDNLKINKTALSLFTDLINNIPDSTTLIMTTRSNKPPDFIKSSELKKIKVVQFWKYFDEDIYNYIVMNIKKYSLKIENNAVDLLISLTGKDIKKIDDAIDMIRFSGETGIINADMIKNYINDVKDASIFEFIDLLFKKDKRSLFLLKKLLEEGTTDLFILNMILRQAEMLDIYYSEIEHGNSVDDAMKNSGVTSKNKDSFWQYVKLFPIENVRKVFSLISNTDYQIKSSHIKDDLLTNPVFNLASDMLWG